MKTLREVAVGQTVKVTKLVGEGPVKKTYHGYGNHKRCRNLCQKSCTAW